MRVACCNAAANRIGDHRKHDRNGAGRLLQRRRLRGGRGQDDIRRERHQLRRIVAGGIVAEAPASGDPYVATLGPTQLLQRLQERGDAGLRLRIVSGLAHKHPERRTRSGCWAPAVSGHAAAAPARLMMNSRRRILHLPKPLYR